MIEVVFTLTLLAAFPLLTLTQLTLTQLTLTQTTICKDSDDDGRGWNGVESCQVLAAGSAAGFDLPNLLPSAR